MATSAKIQGKPRQRGVRASRAKLERALHRAGLKTQAALAEKIAEREDIVSPPKDLVSKAFREILVEPQSLERIAAALDVPAYTLYQTQEDAQSQPVVDTAAESSKSTLSSSKKTGAIALFIFITVTLIAWRSWTLVHEQAPLTLPGLKPSILIYPQDKWLYTIADELKIPFEKDFEVTLVPLALNTFNHSHNDLKKSYQSDVVVTVQTQHVGRYSGIRLYLSDGSFDYLIASPSISQHDMLSIVFDGDAMHEMLRANTKALLSTQKPLQNTGLLNAQQQQQYLLARQLTEDYQSFETLNEAQRQIEQLVREKPFFAAGHALLCEIAIYESWRQNEKAALEYANKQCQKAISLAPDDLYIQSVLGFLYDKTGQRVLAQEQFENILQRHPNNTEALMGLATVHFNRFKQTGSQADITDALNLARKAATSNEHYWRTHQLLAVIGFASGEVNTAIQAWEAQVSIKPNELTLTNLGLMYLCRGQLSQSEEKFQQARALAPNSYMPLEGLASLNYYRGNYAEALSLRTTVQQLIANEDAGIHQQWGDLADSYRHLGRLQEARDAYRTALLILERDTLRGNTSQDDQIYRLYYEAYLLPDSSDHQHIGVQLAELINHPVSTPALAKKALLLKRLNRIDESVEALQQASSQCPIYMHLPEFVANQ